ncbi:hypothetical protein [Burkholderia multivorans]|uniref:hypothetical protein n=1 Tax=Burkholderia multivorans TaxID=87883 RepID=UPI0011B1E033|nr:hypothetical protein [Burkholderia multivorans]
MNAHGFDTLSLVPDTVACPGHTGGQFIKIAFGPLSWQRSLRPLRALPVFRFQAIEFFSGRYIRLLSASAVQRDRGMQRYEPEPRPWIMRLPSRRYSLSAMSRLEAMNCAQSFLAAGRGQRWS